MSGNRLQDKVVVIVGGTSGMGFSSAKACVAEGAAVVIVGLEQAACEEAVSTLGTRAVAVAGDARRPDTVARAIQRAVATFHGFHGLYHVAGGSGRSIGDGPLGEISDQGWQRTLELNLESVFYSNRAAVRQFLQQGSGGSVLNLSSVLAFAPAPRYFATHAYATAKAGILGLTTSSAAYYAPQNIRFNALAPALVDTPMARRAVGNREIVEYVRSKQPLEGGRVGMPADLDDAVVFFLSDASRFVTGQVLSVDGGWSLSDGQVNS
jgi:NAD(P)-dependent dehydrogenase (short-subunit alcohol dehydrogenase family)